MAAITAVRCGTACKEGREDKSRQKERDRNRQKRRQEESEETNLAAYRFLQNNQLLALSLSFNSKLWDGILSIPVHFRLGTQRNSVPLVPNLWNASYFAKL